MKALIGTLTFHYATAKINKPAIDANPPFKN